MGDFPVVQPEVGDYFPLRFFFLALLAGAENIMCCVIAFIIYVYVICSVHFFFLALLGGAEAPAAARSFFEASIESSYACTACGVYIVIRYICSIRYVYIRCMD